MFYQVAGATAAGLQRSACPSSLCRGRESSCSLCHQVQVVPTTVPPWNWICPLRRGLVCTGLADLLAVPSWLHTVCQGRGHRARLRKTRLWFLSMSVAHFLCGMGWEPSATAVHTGAVSDFSCFHPCLQLLLAIHRRSTCLVSGWSPEWGLV